MKRFFMALVGVMVLSISAHAAQGEAPAAQKEEMPTMTMTMCDKMGTSDCAMAKTTPAAAGDAKGQMPANCPMGKACAPGQGQMPANCPMGEGQCTMETGQCQMNDTQCQMHCSLQSVVDVLKLQEKVIVGVRATEKKKLVAEIDKKIAALDALIAQMNTAPKAQMPCVQPCVPAATTAPATAK
ncbi:MAG TPA: hypothetical protein VN371_02360 [Chlorobaculum sp.]|nr:hypothetical protein [Chlorobaculum sp.]